MVLRHHRRMKNPPTRTEKVILNTINDKSVSIRDIKKRQKKIKRKKLLDKILISLEKKGKITVVKPEDIPRRIRRQDKKPVKSILKAL